MACVHLKYCEIMPFGWRDTYDQVNVTPVSVIG